MKIETDQTKIEVKKDGDKSNEKYFSSIKFGDLNLSEQTTKAIDELGFKTCSEI